MGYQSFSREQEVKQLINIIKTEPKANILRTDLKSFYENVNFREMITNLEKDGFNNVLALNTLKRINQFCSRNNSNGLPRGMSISSHLSDYAMRHFDKKIKMIPSICYYCRYVDDIIIVFTSNNLEMLNSIKKELPKGIVLNKDKTENKVIGEEDWIEYLGYCINLKDPVKVKIAESKINRAKKRIILSIKEYLKNSDFNLLCDRMIFLTSNTIMEMHTREKPLTIGYRYSYELANSYLVEKQMEELDNFLFGIYFSKRYSLSNIFRKKIKKNKFSDLKKYSFKQGYTNKITHKKNQKEIFEIKRAWNYA